MDWNSVYKIKDSIDIYLVNESYLMIYFMNTRIRKQFRINENVISIIEELDGEKRAKEIFDIISSKFDISRKEYESFIDTLINIKVICKKIESHILDEYYLTRYDRQINYFTEFLGSEEAAEKAQKKLINASVGIVGCGAVGGDIAIQLAMAGVEKFVLMDYDIVAESDVARHLFYSKEDIGRKKIELLSDKLKKINKRIKTFVSFSALTPNTKLDDFLEQSDFIVNTADEPYLGYTAQIISEKCVPKKKPHYIAGGFDAHLASTGELIIPYVTPCASCYATYFSKVLADWKPEKHPIVNRANEIGGLSSMSLFASSFACIEIIKYLCDLVDMNKNYHSRAEFFFNGMNLDYLKPKKNPHCKVCGDGNV